MRGRSRATGGAGGHRSAPRSTRGTDGRSLEAALAASSLLLWLPYSLAAVYVAYCRSFRPEGPMGGQTAVGYATAASSVSGAGAMAGLQAQSGGVNNSPYATASAGGALVVGGGPSVLSYGPAYAAATVHSYSTLHYYIFPAGFDIAIFLPLFLLRVLPVSVLAVLVTYFLSVHKTNGGEYLMAVAWALGTCSGYGWLISTAGSTTTTPAGSEPSSSTIHPFALNVSASGTQTMLVSTAAPPSWLWVVVSLLTGLFSGILCKVKDIVDGKHDRDTHLFPLFDCTPSRQGLRGNISNNGGVIGSVTPASGAAAIAGTPSSSTRAGHKVAIVSDDDVDAPTSTEVDEIATTQRQALRPLHSSNAHHLVSLGDRLYMVVPFCTGQWFAFILHHGWRGIFVANGTILLSLGLVGYTMLSYKFLKRQVLRVSGRVSRSVAARGRERRNERRLLHLQRQKQEQQNTYDATPSVEVEESTETSGSGRPLDPGGRGSATSSRSTLSRGPSTSISDEEQISEDEVDFLEDVGEVAVIDVIELISKLFTTSFGVVVLCVVGLNIFITSLCIPFLKALFKLNALVSGVGIVIELIMYEVA